MYLPKFLDKIGEQLDHDLRTAFPFWTNWVVIPEISNEDIGFLIKVFLDGHAIVSRPRVKTEDWPRLGTPKWTSDILAAFRSSFEANMVATPNISDDSTTKVTN